MKRYLAFYGEVYYPLRGMDDFIGDFDIIEEGIEAIKKAHNENRHDDLEWEFNWGCVWDKEFRTNVFYCGKSDE